ncbi:MAG: LytTR family DNA-binding domain-containing protein [Prolixibacteraceae bacterium]|nr:LytTR family DNA-binding domain-containing protein [Prolixibacteraceae bacterium]
MPISALIVDDEKNGRENLAGLIKTHCPQIRVVGEARSVEQAIAGIQEHQPQLIFLDIEMPGGNGFQLLEHFKDFPFEVIFVTAYDNYAIRAIRFSASDYILKPINLNELVAAVEKVSLRIRNRSENERIRQLYLNTMHPANPKIGLPTGERVEFVEVKSIIRCQGESNYTHLYFSDRKTLLTAKSLIEFEELLAEYNFIRVHKTHLVNLNQVTSFTKNDGGVLFLSNGDSVAISRRRKEFVLEQLKSSLRFS